MSRAILNPEIETAWAQFLVEDIILRRETKDVSPNWSLWEAKQAFIQGYLMAKEPSIKKFITIEDL